MTEGQLLAHIVLQASLVVMDTVARSIAAQVIRQTSCLHRSGFLREVQTTVEDPLFEGSKLFAECMDESLQSLKDSMRSRSICTPALKEKTG